MGGQLLVEELVLVVQGEVGIGPGALGVGDEAGSGGFAHDGVPEFAFVQRGVEELPTGPVASVSPLAHLPCYKIIITSINLCFKMLEKLKNGSPVIFN